MSANRCGAESSGFDWALAEAFAKIAVFGAASEAFHRRNINDRSR